MSFLLPAASHPHPPLPPDELAVRLRVRPEEVSTWIDEGLLRNSDGRIDPFAAADWLCDGRLARCPVLGRRWRTFLRWFAPFARQEDVARVVQVRREQTLFLPGPAGPVSWWLPRLADHGGQRILDRERFDRPVLRSGAHWHASWTVADGPVLLRGQARVGTAPVPPSGADDLLPDLEEWISGFRYHYRHHQPADRYDRPDGSCLDCALGFAGRLSQRGRPWRLLSGVVAQAAVANPHFWLEVEGPGGIWRPIDPSIPAIARQFGREDWRAWARAWCGGCDARRVILLVGDHPVRALPGGATIGSAIGEAQVVIAGLPRNAWLCLDWVCGDCGWGFSR